MFLGNHCKFQWFWRDHCKFSMVFEETITIECFWAVWPLPSMVLRWFFDVATIAFNGFRWFQTIGQTMRWFRWIVVVYLHQYFPLQGYYKQGRANVIGFWPQRTIFYLTKLTFVRLIFRVFSLRQNLFDCLVCQYNCHCASGGQSPLIWQTQAGCTFMRFKHHTCIVPFLLVVCC